jgi:hypothetical protein
MPVVYKNTWTGKWPYALILTAPEVYDVLYYETGFEQLHPILPIHEWMEDRGHTYQKDWNCVTLTPKTEWAIIFQDEVTCELFMLRWL